MQPARPYLESLASAYASVAHSYHTAIEMGIRLSGVAAGSGASDKENIGTANCAQKVTVRQPELIAAIHQVFFERHKISGNRDEILSRRMTAHRP
jgi:nicotinamide mononucleotide (NMN) deamidase PncC